MSLVRASLIFGILPVATAARRSGFDSDEFKLGGRSAPQTQIPFSVGLSYDSAPLAERLAAASDIESPRYGEWLQDDEVVSLAWADPSVRERVREWLAVREVRCVGRPTSLACSATASVIEEVFSTELSSYAFTDSRGEPAVLHRVAPSTAFSLPAGLVAAGARFTSQLLDFPTRRRRLGSVSRITASGTTDPGVSLIALESLAAMYGSVPSSVGASAAATTSASPAEFQGDAAVAAADLRDFISQEGARPWSIARKVGPFAGSDTESTLDEEMLGGASNSSASVAQWFWVEHGWMFEWTEALKNTSRADIPDVFSVSWGWFEGSQCENAPSEGPCAGGGGEAASFAYVEATNAGFMAATARGVTIVAASGDAGAHGRSDPSCESASPLPDWPASSSYVLTVGGTQLVNGSALVNPRSPLCAQTGGCAGAGTEVACSHRTGSLITSGGGFSLVAPQPAWQAAAVKAYLKSGALVPLPGEFNATNRAYPDVSAFAHNIAAFQDGLVQLDGTSAAAPVVAAYIAAANAERVAGGKPTLGFVNPAIYAIAARNEGAFTDVTVGDNTCTGECKAGCSGYGAARGWDAVTGWGSPVVSVLLPALVAL